MGIFDKMNKAKRKIDQFNRMADNLENNGNNGQGKDKYKCKDFGGKTNDGKPCKRKAGWGRDGVKYGCCKHHKKYENKEKVEKIKEKESSNAELFTLIFVIGFMLMILFIALIAKA